MPGCIAHSSQRARLQSTPEATVKTLPSLRSAGMSSAPPSFSGAATLSMDRIHCGPRNASRLRRCAPTLCQPIDRYIVSHHHIPPSVQSGSRDYDAASEGLTPSKVVVQRTAGSRGTTRTLAPCRRRQMSLRRPPGPPAHPGTLMLSCQHTARADAGKSLQQCFHLLGFHAQEQLDAEVTDVCGAGCTNHRLHIRPAPLAPQQAGCMTYLFPDPALPGSPGTAPPGGP